jgi:hypothetical protein
MASFSVLPGACQLSAGLESASAIPPTAVRVATSAVPEVLHASRRTYAFLFASAPHCTAVDPLALAATQVQARIAILQAAPVSVTNSVTMGQHFNWTCGDIATEAVVLTETGQMCNP